MDIPGSAARFIRCEAQKHTCPLLLFHPGQDTLCFPPVLDPLTQILINNLDIYIILRRMAYASSTKGKEEGSLAIGGPVLKSPFSTPSTRTFAGLV